MWWGMKSFPLVLGPRRGWARGDWEAASNLSLSMRLWVLREDGTSVDDGNGFGFVREGWKHSMASAKRLYSVVQLPYQLYASLACVLSREMPSSSHRLIYEFEIF